MSWTYSTAPAARRTSAGGGQPRVVDDDGRRTFDQLEGRQRRLAECLLHRGRQGEYADNCAAVPAKRHRQERRHVHAVGELVRVVDDRPTCLGEAEVECGRVERGAAVPGKALGCRLEELGVVRLG